MKIKHKAPHLEKLKHLDVADRKAVKSYNNTRERKVRALKKGDFVDDDEFCDAIDTVVAYCEDKHNDKIDFLKSSKESNEITHPYDLSK